MTDEKRKRDIESGRKLACEHGPDAICRRCVAIADALAEREREMCRKLLAIGDENGFTATWIANTKKSDHRPGTALRVMFEILSAATSGAKP